MDVLKLDLAKGGAPFKLLNATNGGPFHKRHATDQYRSNFVEYKAARIPYQRNHDSGVCGIYGGPYSHDITRIFPNFDADPTDPASYDFACTDEAILVCLETGTKTFFRLGQTIEHQIKKHGTIPPKDFAKWAVICEHIIRHYTEGWADGFHHDMPYWEIWNEPDLDFDDSTNKRTWGGTKAQFFDLYEIAAKHLKKCFPHLKIGGPALACRDGWARDFLAEMKRREVPIDFFSWHIYATSPMQILQRAVLFREMLDLAGYADAESILNEWNYVKGWGDQFVYSIESIHGMKGAAFMMGVFSLSQYCSIDMLMYYDTRPSAFNGAFDFYTYRPLKGYYPLYWYGGFYDLDHSIEPENAIEDIYCLAGVSAEGKARIILTHYTDDDEAPAREISLDIGRAGKFKVYLLDREHDGTQVDTTESLVFNMENQTSILLEEV